VEFWWKLNTGFPRGLLSLIDRAECCMVRYSASQAAALTKGPLNRHALPHLVVLQRAITAMLPDTLATQPPTLLSCVHRASPVNARSYF